MEIRWMGLPGWAIMLFSMLHGPFANAWILSSTKIIIVPKNVSPFALIGLRLKQQLARRRPICFVKAEEEPPVSITSLKVRAMASFLSMALLESLLASGAPIETILGGASDKNKTTETEIADLDEMSSQDEAIPLDKEISTVEHQKEGDRKFALKDEFSPLTTSDTQLDNEVSGSLHKKEGDRNLALQDGFAPEVQGLTTLPVSSPPAAIPATPTSELDEMDNALPSDDVAQSDPDETEVASVPFSIGAETPHLIPPVPPAISTAFGRSLPVIRDNVPPLQQPPELATVNALAPSGAVVADEDPYGE